MDFKDIISVPGMSGLYKVVGNNKNGFIIESLSDQKRTLINSSQRIMTLSDIAIYTSSEDKPLIEIFQAMQKKDGANPGYDIKADAKAHKAYFKSIVPDFDEDRVYASDIKKVLNWYLILKDQIDFSKVKLDAEEEGDKPAINAEHEKPIPKMHEGHGPKAEHAKTTAARTRKKV